VSNRQSATAGEILAAGVVHAVFVVAARGAGTRRVCCGV
jgi:hypothetical protein